ncbi:hypothetical protein BJP40_01185 [Streptomyces sp. CC53]|nr:hypothetical protein BJP40_01185 [Streptomyces sp. CC53]
MPLASLDHAEPLHDFRYVVDLRDGGVRGRASGELGEALAVLSDALLDGLAQVLPQMEAVTATWTASGQAERTASA